MPGLPVHHEPDARETRTLEQWLDNPKHDSKSWRRAVMIVIVRRIRFAMHVRRYR